jgi:hypothetical protein
MMGLAARRGWPFSKNPKLFRVQIGYRMIVNKTGRYTLVRVEKISKNNKLIVELKVRDAGVAGSNPATPTSFH